MLPNRLHISVNAGILVLSMAENGTDSVWKTCNLEVIKALITAIINFVIKPGITRDVILI